MWKADAHRKGRSPKGMESSPDAKRAGLVVLIAMPFLVFCLAYPSAGYLVWHSDGSGWFEPPEPPVAIALTIVFFLFVFASLTALRRKKWSLYLFAFSALLAGIVLTLSRWSKAFLPAFAGWPALFLAFAVFLAGNR